MFFTSTVTGSMMSVPPRKCGGFLFPVCALECVTARVRRRGAGQHPDPLAYFGPRGTDRGQSLRPACGELVDEPGDGRVGGHRPEHGRLGPQHADIDQAVPAQRDRQGHVRQDLPRIVYRPRPPPRRERRRYRGVQAALADCLGQQHSSGLGDHRPATALDADTRVRPDTLLHLESASFRAANRTLDKSHRCRSGALSAYLIKSRTAGAMKARG
jgi:hypothetical protein